MKFKLGDIVTFGNINEPFCYGKIYNVSSSTVDINLIFPLECDFKFEPCFSPISKHGKCIGKKDCSIVRNKKRIEEIYHMAAKVMVFKWLK